MTTEEVIKKFKKIVEKNKHAFLPSAPIISQGDATTLFTGSGVQPLLPYILGKTHPKGTRLANVQKCFRAGDINDVGDLRHTTYFQMLGNWSLGDYFKKEQLTMFFEFLTSKEYLNLDPHKLYVTVFSGDKETNIDKDEDSAHIWKELFASVDIDAGIAHIGSQQEGNERGIKKGERIFYYDANENWWSRTGVPSSMREGEPGGPDSEVFYDFGEEYNTTNTPSHPASDNGRFMEIGNSVFMLYKKEGDTFVKLNKKNVDFGGGVERLAAATSGVPDVFKTSELYTIIKKIEEVSAMQYKDNYVAMRIIADHIRASSIMIAEGLIPHSQDAGYILRRLMRRAMYQAQYVLSLNAETLVDIVISFLETTSDREVKQHRQNIIDIFKKENEQFTKILQQGIKKYNHYTKHNTTLSGESAYILTTTYGIPFEMLEEISISKGVSIDIPAYNTSIKKHKALSQTAGVKKFKGGLEDTDDICVKYHTATHLLHAALRNVLGDHIQQKGSNITKERLRFDFSHTSKLTTEEKSRVENLVNEYIASNIMVTYKDCAYEEAKQEGAIGVFEDMYGDIVRVYTIGDISKEFCGGPHIKHTGELGAFTITKEESVASGIRRIKAILA